MSTDNDKKVCIQCSMHSVFGESSGSKGFRFELIPLEIRSKEYLDQSFLKCNTKTNFFSEIIDLNDYPYPHYFSKIPVMLLLDDLLSVDIILVIDYYHSFCSTHMMLRYRIGHESLSYLTSATVMCKEILKSSLGSLDRDRSMFFTKFDGSNLLRIYLKDFDLEENESTVEKIKEAIKGNKQLEKVGLRIRGRYSGYSEESLKRVSPETTYIQLEGDNLKFYFQDIFGLLKNLRESINQEKIKE